MNELIETVKSSQRLDDRNTLQDVMLELLHSDLEPSFKLGVLEWLQKADDKLKQIHA